MKIITKNFGELEVDENEIITFANGLPGFESDKKFILIDDEAGGISGDGTFSWLQSVRDADLCFVLIDACNVFSDYNPLVDETQFADLGDYDEASFITANIARFPENVKDATVNLAAPLLINTKLRKGKQVICSNEDYTVRHYIFKNE